MRRQNELNLAGKVVILTGASRGIGRQMALDFAKRGAYLVLAARTVAQSDELPGTLGDTLKQIESAGGRAIAVPTNLASREDLKKLVDRATAEFGGVDILINNAAATVGGMWESRFLDLSYEDWLYQFDVNVHAPFLLMQMVVPIMERRGAGRIINITTGCGECFRLPEEPAPVESVSGINLIVPGYYASKRALDRLSSVIAPELAKKNIFVISLMPGYVATPIVEVRLKKVASEAHETVQPISIEVPSRMTVYFAACDDPREYNGRIFWAEREMAAMQISAR